MAVYRVNKNRGYTVMANFHLRDKNLSLKAVGLLSKMLSFNDGWKFSTRGLSAICKEGPDAILSALRELERHGYLVRHRQRDSKGRLSSTIFDIFEEPQPVSPDTGSPHMENPDMDILQPDLQALPARSSPAGAGIGGRDPPSQRNPPLQGLRCILYGRFRTSQILCGMFRQSTPKAEGSTRPKKEVGRRQLTPCKPFARKAFQRPLFKSAYVFT